MGRPAKEVVETPKEAEVVEKVVEQKSVPLVVGVKTLNGTIITFSSSNHEDPKRAAVMYAQKCGGMLLD